MIEYFLVKPDHAAQVLHFLAAIHDEQLLTLNRMSKLPSEERIVGFLHAEILQPKEMSVNCEFGLSILAEYRRQGIASHLIQQAEDWAWAKGSWRMELGVYSNNVAGIKLYEKLGYRIDGRRVNAVKLWNGEIADIVHMYKFLNDPK